MSTIQVDLMLPDRFDLEITAPDGSRQRPVMIHRALFGSIERFMAVLVEHYAGAFPPWLAFVQRIGIPVAAEYGTYLQSVADRLQAAGVRRGGHPDDWMQKKIRNAERIKVPYILIAGGGRRRRRGFVPISRPATEERDPDRCGDQRDHRRLRRAAKFESPTCQNLMGLQQL